MKKTKKIIAVTATLAAVICVMAVIFGFSAQVDVDTNAVSERVSGWAARLFFFSFDSFDDSQKQMIILGLNPFIRKLAHMTMYMLLGFGISVFIRCVSTSRFRIIIPSAFVLSIIYAITDELHQSMVDGRSAKVTDVFIDGFGAFIGILFYVVLYVIITRIIHYCTERKKQNGRYT